MYIFHADRQPTESTAQASSSQPSVNGIQAVPRAQLRPEQARQRQWQRQKRGQRQRAMERLLDQHHHHCLSHRSAAAVCAIFLA